MASSKTRNYHICDILFNICKDNIFHNNKYIKFISIISPSFIHDTKKFSHCMELINAIVKSDQIETFKIKLDKAEMKIFVIKLTSSAS